jgi:hypothetical protein
VVSAQELFQRIVQLSGLPQIIGPGMVRRALADGGLEAAVATAPCYQSILSRLDARMRAYLPAQEAELRVRWIIAFLATATVSARVDEAK